MSAQIQAAFSSAPDGGGEEERRGGGRKEGGKERGWTIRITLVLLAPHSSSDLVRGAGSSQPSE